MSDAANNAPLQQGPSAPLQAVVAGRGLNRRLRGSRRWTTVLPVTLFAIATSCELSWAMAPRYQESTDDAYLTGNTVQVTADIAGTVVAIGSEDNQFVHAGQLVVALDDTDARIAVERAKTNLDNTAREVRRMFASMAVSAGRFDTTSVSSNPDVLGADDQVDVAYLQLARTKLPASVSGFVAKRMVELGQHVSPGQPVMVIVPLNELWVEAHFAERQLASMRVGQLATLKAHLNGASVTYHGTVADLGTRTTPPFRLAPLRRAMDDRNKFTKRVPVCIALDSRELLEHPLQLGLSMSVAVDTQERKDARPTDLATDAATRSPNRYKTLCRPNFGSDMHEAMEGQARLF